jgi:hypothetical protein
MGTSTGGYVHLSHPQLGSIKGLVQMAGVNQFRSLPYASIPNRFADPVVVNSLGAKGTFDATEFGPIAPQPDDAEYQEFVTPKEHIPHKPLVQDEFKCCNLNISVPTGSRKDRGKGLPVMVWFHGGSFMLGSASWPQYGMPLPREFIPRFREICKAIIGDRTTSYWCWRKVVSIRPHLIQLPFGHHWVPCFKRAADDISRQLRLKRPSCFPRVGPKVHCRIRR